MGNERSKKYRIVKGIELFFVVILVISLLFRLMQWPGGPALSILSIGMLSITYFILWQIGLGERSNALSNLYPRGVSLTLSIAVMGILFRYLIWPGGTVLINFSMLLAIILLILGIALLLFASDKVEPSMLKWGLWRLVPVMIPLVFFSLVNPFEYYKMVGPYKDNPKYMELYNNCYYQKEDCKEYRAYSDSLRVVKYGH